MFSLATMTTTTIVVGTFCWTQRQRKFPSPVSVWTVSCDNTSVTVLTPTDRAGNQVSSSTCSPLENVYTRFLRCTLFVNKLQLHSHLEISHCIEPPPTSSVYSFFLPVAAAVRHLFNETSGVSGEGLRRNVDWTWLNWVTVNWIAAHSRPPVNTQELRQYTIELKTERVLLLNTYGQTNTIEFHQRNNKTAYIMRIHFVAFAQPHIDFKLKFHADGHVPFLSRFLPAPVRFYGFDKCKTGTKWNWNDRQDIQQRKKKEKMVEWPQQQQRAEAATA